jgi:hypothetical protein
MAEFVCESVKWNSLPNATNADPGPVRRQTDHTGLQERMRRA